MHLGRFVEEGLVFWNDMLCFAQFWIGEKNINNLTVMK